MFSALQLTFLSVDSAAGRVDKYTMSEQSLMELLVAEMKDLRHYKDRNGDFRDIEQWHNLKFENGSVVEIKFFYDNESLIWSPGEAGGNYRESKLGGSVDFQWVPTLVRKIEFEALGLTGTLETYVLPPHLGVLLLSCNMLSGTFSVEGLPRKLREVSIEANRFHGPLALRELPPRIELFLVGGNRFSGTVDLKNLARSIISLDLSDNQFHGVLDISALPANIKKLMVNGNAFDKRVLRVGAIPPSLRVIDVNRSAFTRVVDVAAGTPERLPSKL